MVGNDMHQSRNKAAGSCHLTTSFRMSMRTAVRSNTAHCRQQGLGKTRVSDEKRQQLRDQRHYDVRALLLAEHMLPLQAVQETAPTTSHLREIPKLNVNPVIIICRLF
jgi:hypothetical protein